MPLGGVTYVTFSRRYCYLVFDSVYEVVMQSTV